MHAGGGRRGAAAGADGAQHRRTRDRDGVDRREGQARPRRRRERRHPLHESDFEAETRRLTDGKGVDVVYDSVGKTTFEKGLNVLRPRGYMVLFGGSSGAVPPFDLIQLSQKGSLLRDPAYLGALHRDSARNWSAVPRMSSA